jgi:hypothetical protein
MIPPKRILGAFLPKIFFGYSFFGAARDPFLTRISRIFTKQFLKFREIRVKKGSLAASKKESPFFHLLKRKVCLTLRQIKKLQMLATFAV